MNKLMELWKQYKELFSYLFWGGMTTVVSWGSYSLIELLLKRQTATVSFFGMELPVSILMANVLSWVIAVLFAYVTNKLWVFGSTSWKADVVWKELGKFVSARVLTGVLEILAVPLLVGIGLDHTLFGVEGMVAKMVVSIAVVVLNYVFSKLFIFTGTE